MSNGILRIGLLGCGTISQFAHLPALMRAKGVQLTAICVGGRDLLRKIGRQTGVTDVFTDYEEFLEKGKMDSVLIAVPDEFHLPVARRALEARKPVVGE